MIDNFLYSAEVYEAQIRVLSGQFWVEIDQESYPIDSISFTTGCYDGSTPGIGYFYHSTISVSMRTTDLIKTGTVIEVKFLNGQHTFFPGVFVVQNTPSDTDSEIFSFTAVSKVASMSGKETGLPVHNQGIGADKWDVAFANHFMMSARMNEGGLDKNSLKSVGCAINFLEEVTGATIEFDRISDANIEKFKELPFVVPVNAEVKRGIDPDPEALEDWYDLILKHTRITINDIISGIAFILGGNAYEFGGSIVFIPKLDYAERDFFEFRDGANILSRFDNKFYASYEVSRETYGISSIVAEYTPVCFWNEEIGTQYGHVRQPSDMSLAAFGDYVLYYAGESKTKGYALVSQGDNGADIKYQQIVQNDWAGATGTFMTGYDSLPALYKQEQVDYSRLVMCVTQGDMVYHVGKLEIAGLLDGPVLGSNVAFYDGNEKKSIYGGEVTYTWDGGFSTEIRSSCGVDASTGVATTSSSGSSSSASAVSASNNVMNATYSAIDFSNALENSLPGFVLKEKTIEGWAIKDGEITGSLISQNTITGNNIAGNTITGNNIVDNTLTGNLFEDGTITGSKIDNSTITNSHIVDGTLDGNTKIANATISFEKVDTSFIDKLTANDAYIANLTAHVANIDTLKATDGIIKNIFSESIISDEAVIDVLKSNIIDADYIKAVVADVGALTADEADIRYATIDFSNVGMESVGKLYADSGILTDMTIVDGNVTGRLNGVKISADVIDAGTLSTDRLLVTGEDGIVYKINVNSSGLSMSELADEKYQKYLNGTDIVANSITASQIAAKTLTANEINAKSIAGAVGEFIEINAGQITSGKISSQLIDANSILAQKVNIGTEFVTVKETDTSTMISELPEVGGTKINGGYIENTNSAYKNIVPLCGLTENRFSVGDVIRIKAFLEIPKMEGRLTVKAFIRFYDDDGYGKSDSVTSAMKIVSYGVDPTMPSDGKPFKTTFNIPITIPKGEKYLPDAVARTDGTSMYYNRYFILGFEISDSNGTTHGWSDYPIMAKEGSAILTLSSLSVIGDINCDNIYADRFNGVLKGSAILDGLSNSERTYLNDTVTVGKNKESGYTYLYGDSIMIMKDPADSSAVSLRLGTNSIECVSGSLEIEAGTNVIIKNPSLLLNDGNFDRRVATVYADGSTANNGSELVLTASGNSFLGAGESPGNLRTALQSGVAASENYGKTGERLYLSSDTDMYLYTNCNTIASRKGIMFSTGGYFRPLTSGGITLGGTSYPFNEIFGKTIYEDGTSLANKYQKKIGWVDQEYTRYVGNGDAYTISATTNWKSTYTCIGYNIMEAWPLTTWTSAGVSVARASFSGTYPTLYLTAETYQQYRLIVRFFYVT